MKDEHKAGKKLMEEMTDLRQEVEALENIKGNAGPNYSW